jgi:hypothetical protein
MPNTPARIWNASVLDLNMNCIGTRRGPEAKVRMSRTLRTHGNEPWAFVNTTIDE